MILKKLILKDQNPILITNLPEDLYEIHRYLANNHEIHHQAIRGIKYEFAVSFVLTTNDVKWVADKVIPSLEKDAIFWVVYPKKTTKKYKSEISRDKGWEPIGELGYEGVSMIAIDNDWSAFRFRHVDYIKSITRSAKIAITKEGKSKSH